MGPGFQRVLAVVLGAGLGCTTARTGDGGAQSSSGAASSTGSALGTSSGGTASGTSGASGSSTGTGGGSSSSGGSSTGGDMTRSTFVDGGYVFCSLSNATDAGPDGTPGTAVWMCHPDTYFCDLGGDIGNCFQCRGDADCGDQALPTYDPNRLHCDLHSGVAGYQNFCQQCTSNADCVASLVGSFCELSTVDPPGALEPNIELVGFETCAPAVTDCRLVGGPICRELNQTCNPSNGHCENLPTTCATDQDCDGIFSLSETISSSPSISPYLPQPFCVNGACNPCDGGACPNDNACQADADCGNPDSSPLGPSCDPTSSRCVCTSSAQCSGFWPACVGLDAGKVNGSGQAIGVCSCENDAQCGDAGLVCLPPTFLQTYPYANPALLTNVFGAQAGSSFCGVPCSSPDFPACSAVAGLAVCDVQNGLCTYCYINEQCQSSFGSMGPYCSAQFGSTPLDPGFCGCLLDSDCPDGQNCLAGDFFGRCTPSLPHCTPESCGGLFCNWDSGACVNGDDTSSFANCLSDFDCGGDFCDQGNCVACRDGVDCFAGGEAAQGRSRCCRGDPLCVSLQLLDDRCFDVCETDADCLGNGHGARCGIDAGAYLRCGCASDADCAGDAAGPHCDTSPSDSLYGQCTCFVAGDCPEGQQCDTAGLANGGFCESVCGADSGIVCQPCVTDGDCAPGTTCLKDGSCHASCDGGCPAGQVCDTLDQAGNGPDLCYQCVSPVDCPDGLGCNDQSHTCGTCRGPTGGGGPYDCPPDAVCSNYWYGQSGVCLTNCDRQSCPAALPICAVFPGLTPDHAYCFGCLADADCADAGPNAWCDLSINRTVTCQAGPT